MEIHWTPLKSWPHVWPTQRTWRRLIEAADINGLNELGVVRRIVTDSASSGPGRIVVSPERFAEWVDRQGSPYSVGVAASEARKETWAARKASA